MELKYRGVAYESNPTVVTTIEGKVGGKYRGVPWVQRIPQITHVEEPRVELKYRGVPYLKDAVRLNTVKAESAQTGVTHPEMFREQPSVPKRPKIKH